MSRARRVPLTALPATADPAPLAAADAPPDPTCSGCRHWRPALVLADGRRAGPCVALPPSIPHTPTAHGPLCLYPVTTDSTPACGRIDPR